MKKLLLLLIIPFLSFGQQTRYLDEVFCDIELESNVVYGNNVSVLLLYIYDDGSVEKKYVIE